MKILAMLPLIIMLIVGFGYLALGDWRAVAIAFVITAAIVVAVHLFVWGQNR